MNQWQKETSTGSKCTSTSKIGKLKKKVQAQDFMYKGIKALAFKYLTYWSLCKFG